MSASQSSDGKPGLEQTWRTSAKQRVLDLPWPALKEYLRRSLPAHIAVLILAVLALIGPVERKIGPQSYLVLVYFHLFFYPCTPFGEHLENVILNLATAAAGLAITFAAIVGAVHLEPPNSAPFNSPRSSAIGACVLIALCLIGGFFESYTPRLKTAIRTMLFSVAWTITAGSSTVKTTNFTGQFYPAAVAAAAGCFGCLVAWPQTARAACADQLVETLELQRVVLAQSIEDFYKNKKGSKPGLRRSSLKLEQDRKNFIKSTIKLYASYQGARIEITLGRIGVSSLRSLLLYVRQSKAWTTCGMGLTSHDKPAWCDEESSLNAGDSVDGSSATHDGRRANDMTSDHAPFSLPDVRVETEWERENTFQSDVSELHKEVSSAISVIQACVQLTMSSTNPRHPRIEDERWAALYRVENEELKIGDVSVLPPRILLARRKKLDEAIQSFKHSLSAAMRNADLNNVTSPQTPTSKKDSSRDDIFRLDMYDTSFLMATLLEVANETAGALLTCQMLLAKWHTQKHLRILWPSMSLKWWLRDKTRSQTDLNAIFEEDLAQQERFEVELALRERRTNERPSMRRKFNAQLSEWSYTSRLLSWRIKVSDLVTAIKRSLHIRYALKLAFGVGALSLVAWLPASRPWFVSEHGVWLIVTYIWVLETSTGFTFRIALYRAVGTIAGAIYAIIVWYICGQGVRPAIALFICLAEIPAAYFILFSKRAQSLGVVFGLTQSIILLIPLVSQSREVRSKTVVVLGLTRGYQILLGNAVAVIVNLALWPLHARNFLMRSIVGITRQLSKDYLGLARQMLNLESRLSPESAAKFERIETKLQRDLDESNEYLDIMQSEISIVPKPTETLRACLDSLQRIRDLLVLLRRVREAAMPAIRAEACFNVLSLRTELVSCVLLNLWVVGESLLSKSKLPQFLPSCRGALDGLTDAMRQQIEARKQLAPRSRSSSVAGRSGMWENASRTQAPELLSIGQKRQSYHSTRRRRQRDATTSIDTGIHSFEELHAREREHEACPDTTPAIREHRENFSFFFVLAEHALLSEMISEIEKLLVLAKLMVGEQQFFELTYLHEEDEIPDEGGQSRARASDRRKDAQVDTLLGDRSLLAQKLPSQVNDSWMQGYGLTLPLPATAHQRGAGPMHHRTGASMLQSMFGPAGPIVHEGSEGQAAHDTSAPRDGTASGSEARPHRSDGDKEKGNLPEDLEKSLGEAGLSRK